VVLATDTGGPGGTAVTATTGDLRYCIAQADANTGSTSNTIKFSSSVFNNPQTITLNSADGPLVLDPAVPLTIKGPNSDTVTLSGGNATQVLRITGGMVTISDLAITQGFSSAAPGQPESNGGGINNMGTLTLTNCTLDHDSGGSSGGGGGLANLGTATVSNCTFNLDTAGGVGGIYSNGALTLSGTNISNCAGVNGGGLFVGGGSGPASGPATVMNCTFTNDSSSIDGGDVFVEYGPLTINFTGCTLSNSSAGNGGGGLCTDGPVVVNMNTCTISNDTAAQGAGVANSGGTVVLTDCTLANDATGPAGGGGGLLNEGTATLLRCTFSNDLAFGGGGLFNEGLAMATNCTFANNSAVGNGVGVGGGIYNILAGANLTLTNCTVAYNSAPGNGTGGGIDNVAGGSTLNLLNTIVAENTAGSSPDVAGAINTADHNLIGDGTGSTIVTDEGGNMVGGNGAAVIDPRLGPLQDNGGPTQTVALQRGSPAIGKADDAVPPATDQRGHARKDHFGLATDIGAYEYP
jgi:hypothetical protein